MVLFNLQKLWFTKAKAYDQQIVKREDLIRKLKKEGQRNIVIPQLFEDPKRFPLTIYYNSQELSTKPKENLVYAEYWKLDSIRIESDKVANYLNETRSN
jgi:hypothetical protein